MNIRGTFGKKLNLEKDRVFSDWQKPTIRDNEKFDGTQRLFQ